MDDEFDDDSFDFIPDNTLQQLEQGAFTSTQKQRNGNGSAGGKAVQQKPRIQTYGSTGLSRANVGGKGAWKPPQPRTKAQLNVQDAPPASAPEPPSSDYGFDDDEDIIDLDAPSTTIPAASGLPTRPRTETPAPGPARQSRHGSRAPLDPETEAAFAAADAELGAHRPGQWQSAPHLQPKPAEDSAEFEALQARVAALEAEQTRLKASEKQARDAALAKQGEISIVRSNQEKAVKEYERRIAAIQKQHTDESTKWKSELEAGKKERERMNTDNRFLQHDLAQEVEKGKRLTGPGKARTAVNGFGTPRKNKKATQGMGDGFDDDEVRMISPSRSKEKEKSREQTPRAGSKRKRPANDSPVPALSFSQAPGAVNGEQAVSRETSFQGQIVQAPAREDTRFEFMQRLLAHTSDMESERTAEALSKHHYPSDSRRSLAALFMDSLSAGLYDAQENFPIKTARALLNLWSRALMEKYYKPVALLLDLLRFTIAFEPASAVSQLIEGTVPLCTHCIEKVVQILHRSSTNPSWLSTTDYQDHAAVLDDLDIDEMLDFLLEMAGIASLSTERIEVFWRLIDMSALLSMLNKVLSISQVSTALQILSTSTLETSFGPICNESDGAAKQTKSEKDIVDRLTILLFDKPKAPADEPPYTEVEITTLRVEVLQVLKSMCITDHGCTMLTTHRSFIGRLIRFLDRQVNALYDVRPSFGLEVLSLESDTPSEPRHHDLLIQTITLSTTTLYTLLQHADTQNTNFSFLTKLQAVKGGYHKFLTSLTRLAFSEQLVFEHGIGDEVVEAAHSVLDNVLSPEEGDAILKALETPRGTRGSVHTGDTTERDTSEEIGEGDGNGDAEAGNEEMEEKPG